MPYWQKMSAGVTLFQVPFDYATSVCNLFAQLGAQGVSVLFSSGDDGLVL